MHHKIHCSTVYNSQDMDSTSMSFDRGMDKEDALQIHNEMLLSQNEGEIMPSAAT